MPPPQAAALQELPAEPAARARRPHGQAAVRRPPGAQARPRRTFHFGEGQDRTVAGAERGHPGRVLLHGEPSASRSHGRLHPGAGGSPGCRRPPPCRSAGSCPGPARLPAALLSLTAAAAPRSTSSGLLGHSTACTAARWGCCKLRRHGRGRSPRPPRLTCSAPARTPAAASSPGGRSWCSLGRASGGLPAPGSASNRSSAPQGP